MKTVIPKLNEIKQDWLLYDAEGQVLGRLAVEIAKRIRGKYKPHFTPFMDTGDNIIVINAEKVALTGNKKEVKTYWRYTGYPGGGRETSFRQMISKHPERVIEHAVKGMLPKNRLGRKLFKKLHVYAGPEHPHKAQKPKQVELK
ncbi:MAG: 50S ribosomal protein L13 [candidate division Zixibacteria bacterium]|nr:50S ribosomal protein L13 [candidate division Zixibacteria bacterium]